MISRAIYLLQWTPLLYIEGMMSDLATNLWTRSSYLIAPSIWKSLWADSLPLQQWGRDRIGIISHMHHHRLMMKLGNLVDQRLVRRAGNQHAKI